MSYFADYKSWIAAIAIGLTFYAYIPYLRGIFAGQTKPHLFTWLIWALITLIAFIIQLVEGGKAGSWPTAVAGLLCILVAILALKYGSRDIRPSDWFFLVASLCGIPLWMFTKDPTASALLITLVEISAAFPTLRKSWTAPGEEIMQTYALNTIRYLLSLIALAHFSIATTAYPVGMVLMNGAIFSVLLIRSKHV